ncbi:hypothetical protein ACW4TU_09185 [Streptomyces sp. QTS52]
MPSSPAAPKTRGAAKRRKPPNARCSARRAEDCGQKFTDDRWKASTAVEWDRGDGHPHLCDDCKYRALEAEQRARSDERERQEQERQSTPDRIGQHGLEVVSA